MYCAIYLNTDLDREALLVLLKYQFENSIIAVIKSLQIDRVSIYISKNSDFNPEKSKEFPDGFLYFRYIIDVESDSEDEKYFVSILNKLLQFFWHKDMPAIGSYDDEFLLLEHGGYNNRNVPWRMHYLTEVSHTSKPL